MRFKKGDVIVTFNKPSCYSWDMKGKKIFGIIVQCDRYHGLFEVKILNDKQAIHQNYDGTIQDSWVYTSNEMRLITKEEQNEVIAWLI